MNATTETPANLDVLLDVPVNLSVVLGGCQMAMRDVLQLASGSVVQLDRLADEPVDLFANGKLVARGEVVMVEDSFGVKITEVIGNSAPA
jgi:flagellar motor switch protein FliN